MCGRFTLTADLREFAESFAVKPDPKKHNPRYNICPSQNVPVILNDGSQSITEARWGLVPSWAKDPTIGNRLANARAEGIEDKPSFRVPFRKHRCVILADGFYEWANRPGEKLKIPYYFRLSNRAVFGFAGLWDTWRDPTGKTELLTCCLITTPPNSLVEKVHDRMPVILEQRFYNIWLSMDEQPVERLKLCLRAYPPTEMTSHMVSTFVNKPANDDPQCIQPAGTGGCH
jgi:putative SOS response-associated peptidase YedK